MEFNPNSKLNLVHLVTEYETKSRNGDNIYLDEKTFIDLIRYYEQNYFFEKALEVSDLALEQYRYSAELLIKRASLLLTVKQSDLAMNSLDQAETFSPEGIDVHILRAKVLLATKRHTEALDIIRRLKDTNDVLCEELYLTEAMIYESCKDFESMYRVLTDCLKINPNNKVALEMIMSCIEVLRNYDDSETLHQKLLDLDPYIYMAWYNLGNTFSSIGEYCKAIEAYEYSFIINPEFEDAYLECVEMCVQIGDYNKALKFNLEYLEQFGEDEETYARIGICYLHLGILKEAKKNLRKSLKLDPYNEDVQYHLAKTLLENNEYTQALNMINKALSTDSSVEEYLCLKGEILAQLDEVDTADYFFRKAETTGPERTEIWMKHAMFLFKIGEYQKALQTLEQAEENAEGMELEYGKIACLLKLNFKPQAVSCLQNALVEDFCKHKYLYDFDSDLNKVSYIAEMIEYYRGESDIVSL